MKNTETEKNAVEGYVAPALDVIDIQMETVFCQSMESGKSSTDTLTEEELEFLWK